MLTRRFFIIMTDQTTPFLDTGRVDQYFLNTQRVLEGEGRDPWVVMEVFPNADGLLCGIVEVLSFLREVLPDDAEVWALEEGAIMARKEVVLRIRAAYRVFGLYETTLLGTLAHGSGWATAARLCLDAAGEVPVISFGARHVHPAVSDRMEYAALIAGCATPAGGALAGSELCWWIRFVTRPKRVCGWLRRWRVGCGVCGWIRRRSWEGLHLSWWGGCARRWMMQVLTVWAFL